MEVTGILKLKYDTHAVSEKFKKREFVLTTEVTTSYPQHVLIQVTQDKCDLIDKFNIGDEIKVHFNLRGREWNGPQGVKYFNTIEAWRLELASAGTTTNNLNNDIQMQSSGEPIFQSNTQQNDDLPF